MAVGLLKNLAGRFGFKNFAVPDALPSSSAGLGPGGNPLFLNGRQGVATRSSAVMSVVNWATTSFVEPPLVIQSQTADGWESNPDHKAVQFLATPDPRAKSTLAHLLSAMVFDLILDGNAYLHKLRGKSGNVVGLAYFPASAVEPYCDPRTGELLRYDVIVYGGVEKIPPEDIVHVMDGIDPSKPSKGRSRLKAIAREIATDTEIIRYTNALLNSPAPGLLVSVGVPNLTFEQASDIKKSIKKAVGGEGVGDPLVFGKDASASRLGFSPEEMSLHQLPRLMEERITAVFGLPAVIAGLGAGLDRSTFSNYKEAREAAVEQFLVPKWRLVETALTLQLGKDLGLRAGERFWFDITLVRALQEDQNDLWARANAAFVANTIDRATWKRQVGMKPEADDEGVYSWQLKGTPLGDFMAEVAKGRRNDVPS